MRLAFGVIGLLIAAYFVLNLGKRQAEALAPRAASAVSAASAPVPGQLPQQVQQDVQKLLEQGAQRASEAAP